MAKKQDPKARRIRAWQRMPPGLRQDAEAIGKLLQKSNVHEVRQAYLVGSAITRFDAPELCGDHVRRQIAGYFGLTDTEAVAAAKLAAAFSADEAERLAQTFLANGSLLTAQHLIAVADLAARGERYAFLKRACDEALTARQLEKLVDDHRRTREMAQRFDAAPGGNDHG